MKPLEGYELKELKLRKRGEVLREIPDTFYAKKFIPLAENTFTAMRLMDDWKAYELSFEDVEDQAAKSISVRLDESIKISEAVKNGKITRLKETVCFWGYPPSIPVRMDMQNLSTKMIYGPSVDISFACLSDMDRDLVYIFNLHVEENLPVDYWFLLKSEEPEIFDRRHMKLGIRLRDIGKRIKDNVEAARRIKDILIDVRNEKTPQWAQSAYYICIFFMVGGANMTLELSNWNVLGQVWDGVNAKNYGLSDCIFNYEPLPPILQMMFGLDRPIWIERLTKALMENYLYLNYFEKEILESIKTRHYEVYDYYIGSILTSSKKEFPSRARRFNAKLRFTTKRLGRGNAWVSSIPRGHGFITATSG